MWSQPAGVPEFRLVAEKVKEAAFRAANFQGLAMLPRPQAESMGQTMVTGLLQQLRSTPSELLGIEYCYNECPSLRQMQAEAVNANLRKNTESLKPEIKEFTPPDIYEKSQIMCAALARFWCGVIKSNLPMLPYVSIGVEDRANVLLHKFLKATGSLGERSVKTVDAWAEDLDLKGMYKWTFRAKQL